MFWSEIGSGFGEPGGTPLPNPPPPPPPGYEYLFACVERNKMDSELLLKFIEYFPDYLSALSRTLLRLVWTTFLETAVNDVGVSSRDGHTSSSEGEEKKPTATASASGGNMPEMSADSKQYFMPLYRFVSQ